MLVRRSTVSPIASCEARTLPITTGSTASRCDGLGSSETCTRLPATSMSVDVPRWYFTSPEPPTSSGLKLPPTNSLNSAVNGLRTMLTSVFSRPRCGMPITTPLTPPRALSAMIACSAGIVASPPSRPNRLVPTNRFWQNASKPSASVRCCRKRIRSSLP